MDGSKKILAFIFSLLFLFSYVLPNLCLAVEFSSTPKGQTPYFSEVEHSHHQHSPCNNKIPCPNNHSCCNLIAQGIVSHFVVLDSCLLNPVETIFQPSVITKLFYRPPRTHL